MKFSGNRYKLQYLVNICADRVEFRVKKYALYNSAFQCEPINTLHKICQNMGFLGAEYSLIRTEYACQRKPVF